MDFAELMRATRRHWIYGLVAGVVGVIGTIAAGGALASDPGSTAPVTSHVRLAFVPKTDSVETAADTATYIETQMAYWFQLSQTDETLTEANGGDGSPSALARTRADCVVEQPALNLMELKCTSTESDDDDTRAFLVVWSEAVSASVMDRGIADGLRESILISNVTAPITSDTPPAGSADASALIYPFALLVGLIAAMTAIMVRHRGTRRPRIGRPFASSESEAE